MPISAGALHATPDHSVDGAAPHSNAVIVCKLMGQLPPCNYLVHESHAIMMNLLRVWTGFQIRRE